MSFPRHQFAIEAHKSSIIQITCYSPELQTKSTQHYHHSPEQQSHFPWLFLRQCAKDKGSTLICRAEGSSCKLPSGSASQTLPISPRVSSGTNPQHRQQDRFYTQFLHPSGKPPHLDAQGSPSSSASVASLLSTRHNTWQLFNVWL